jgi:hypothetical protein
MGAGMGIWFCRAIMYEHHREIIIDKAKSDLVETSLRENLGRKVEFERDKQSKA